MKLLLAILLLPLLFQAAPWTAFQPGCPMPDCCAAQADENDCCCAGAPACPAPPALPPPVDRRDAFPQPACLSESGQSRSGLCMSRARDGAGGNREMTPPRPCRTPLRVLYCSFLT